MSNLSIQECNGVLVVDSRLIAEELGIQHKNFLATIEKYNLKMASDPEMGTVAFETREFKTRQGNVSTERWAWLTEPQATFIMTLSRNTEQVVNCKLALSIAFDKAKRLINEAISTQFQELERIKLELQLILAKQRYQDTGYAIQLSTSAATLAWLRGEPPPPLQIEYRERFIDASTGREVGSSKGRSLTQLITDTGLNPKSTRDRNFVKRVLKCCGMDYDSGQRWSTTSYLREYPVLSDEAYDQALKAVLDEVVAAESQPNLFVHQMQQMSLTPHTPTQEISGIEP